MNRQKTEINEEKGAKNSGDHMPFCFLKAWTAKATNSKVGHVQNCVQWPCVLELFKYVSYSESKGF